MSWVTIVGSERTWQPQGLQLACRATPVPFLSRSHTAAKIRDLLSLKQGSCRSGRECQASLPLVSLSPTDHVPMSLFACLNLASHAPLKSLGEITRRGDWGAHLGLLHVSLLVGRPRHGVLCRGNKWCRRITGRVRRSAVRRRRGCGVRLAQRAVCLDIRTRSAIMISRVHVQGQCCRRCSKSRSAMWGCHGRVTHTCRRLSRGIWANIISP